MCVKGGRYIRIDSVDDGLGTTKPQHGTAAHSSAASLRGGMHCSRKGEQSEEMHFEQSSGRTKLGKTMLNLKLVRVHSAKRAADEMKAKRQGERQVHPTATRVPSI